MLPLLYRAAAWHATAKKLAAGAAAMRRVMAAAAGVPLDQRGVVRRVAARHVQRVAAGQRRGAVAWAGMSGVRGRPAAADLAGARPQRRRRAAWLATTEWAVTGHPTRANHGKPPPPQRGRGTAAARRPR